MHSLYSITVSDPPASFYFLRISFMSLRYFGICTKASAKGMLICNFLNKFMNWENCLSVFSFLSFWENGTSGTFGFTSSGSGSSSAFGQRIIHSDGWIHVCCHLLPSSFLCSSLLLSLASSELFASVFLGCSYSSFLPLWRVIVFTCYFRFFSVLLGNDPCSMLSSVAAIWPICTSEHI